MIRYGTVIVFKPFVTQQQAERFIKDLVVDTSSIIENPGMPKSSWGPATTGVHEFDDTIGGPVWYIP